jgi:hypothetical protein
LRIARFTVLSVFASAAGKDVFDTHC